MPRKATVFLRPRRTGENEKAKQTDAKRHSRASKERGKNELTVKPIELQKIAASPLFPPGQTKEIPQIYNTDGVRTRTAVQRFAMGCTDTTAALRTPPNDPHPYALPRPTPNQPATRRASL